MALRADSSSSTASASAASIGSMASSISSSSDSSAVASSAGTDVGTTKTKSSNPNDSCMWHGGNSCGTPRNCYECLNQAIDKEECAIDQYGECVSLSEYEAFLDSRSYYVPNYKYYPSTNYTYCEADDALCSVCKDVWQQQSYMSTDGVSCTGAGGCVCIALCEVDDWEAAVLSMNCESSDSFNMISSSTTTRVLIAAAVGIGVALLFFAIATAVKRYVHNMDNYPSNANSRARRSAERREPRTGPLLNLDGWKSMREKLIQTERAEVLGNGNAAAQQGEASTAETAAIIVEHGDAYRPISPSHMADDHQAAATDNAPVASGTTSNIAVAGEGIGASVTVTTRQSV